MPGHTDLVRGPEVSLNPDAISPHLDGFQHDTGLPSAILIEYLPHPLPLNCVTYSKERMAKSVHGIEQIHSALVEHNDPYPKNILIVPGDPERVMWIDFDVAITYPDSTYIREKERGWIEFETSCVESFGRTLVCTSEIILVSFATDRFCRQMIKNRVYHRTQNITRISMAVLKCACTDFKNKRERESEHVAQSTAPSVSIATNISTPPPSLAASFWRVA
ncbi:hypothetical protein I7I51_06032 [Histoplasma capsulatum]|uniref:Protein kinase domain-containing protein n=1 Tax=Ajellomyces capsulatus TaxID=5037 RepID=A0A8A1MJ81_AJECA|nr:hypothetical protein I7I51_06032 [Histoplasma capsulatum]